MGWNQLLDVTWAGGFLGGELANNVLFSPCVLNVEILEANSHKEGFYIPRNLDGSSSCSVSGLKACEGGRGCFFPLANIVVHADEKLTSFLWCLLRMCLS